MRDTEMSDDLATRVVDSLKRSSGGGDDHRAAHAKGFCLEGTFRATPAARDLTRAKQFSGEPIPVSVRFSNGSGSLAAPDYHVDGRGMAVKFRLPDGTASDIVSLTQKTFFVRTPDRRARRRSARCSSRSRRPATPAASTTGCMPSSGRVRTAPSATSATTGCPRTGSRPCRARRRRNAAEITCGPSWPAASSAARPPSPSSCRSPERETTAPTRPRNGRRIESASRPAGWS
ncbi:MAG: catalase [Chloroflexi bacterium]|nr:MAG: catalase [Chloroflexota bacterium]